MSTHFIYIFGLLVVGQMSASSSLAIFFIISCLIEYTMSKMNVHVKRT